MIQFVYRFVNRQIDFRGVFFYCFDVEAYVKSISYYAFEDNKPLTMDFCSRESSDVPLIVNCAGNFNSTFPFSTVNVKGRLDYYLMHVTQGSISFNFPEGVRHIGAGSTVIFPPRTPYAYSYCGGDELEYHWVHFTGAFAEELLKKLGFFPLPYITTEITERTISANFRAIFDAFSKDEPFKEHSLSATLQQLLVSIARASLSGKEKNPLARSLAYVNASYTEDIRIPELAAMENLSNSRYHVIFRETIGTSPSKYIISLRMRYACELLVSTNMPIKQISMLVGYPDPHFFSKIFKANLRVSPLEYRKGVGREN